MALVRRQRMEVAVGVAAHERLEEEFPWGWNNAACSSGTAALHLALEALELPLGSVVAVPDYTMVACARAVALAGHVPLFVGCDSALLMDLSALAGASFDAVLAVHVYGRRLDMGSLHAAARGAPVVEDMAELHGFKPHAASAAACWSFYKNKVVAGEEGGLVAFRDPALAKRAKQLRCLGFTEAHDFHHVPRGCNYRLADCLAEKVLTSLGEYEANVNRRRDVEAAYDLECPKSWRMPPRQSPWVYDVKIPGLTARKQDAAVRSVPGARHGFKPMSLQKEFRRYPRVGRKAAAEDILYLPLQPEVDAEVAFKSIAESLQLSP